MAKRTTTKRAGGTMARPVTADRNNRSPMSNPLSRLVGAAWALLGRSATGLVVIW